MPGAEGRSKPRSVFQTRPKIEVGGDVGTKGRAWLQTETTPAVFDSSGSIVQAGERLALYVLSVPTGRPENLSVTLK